MWWGFGQSLATGDFNGDGRLDYAVINGASVISVLMNIPMTLAITNAFAPTSISVGGVFDPYIHHYKS